MISVLNAQLADSSNMLSFMKHPHCNVKGPQFIALHELFDEIAAGLLSHVDTLVECATAPGGMALDTTRILSESSRLESYPLTAIDRIDTVLVLANRMAQLAANVRSAAKHAEQLRDMDTNDLFTEISRDLDKWLWFLEARPQKKSLLAYFV
jgi:starvation-inducible DNA-binding protein